MRAPPWRKRRIEWSRQEAGVRTSQYPPLLSDRRLRFGTRIIAEAIELATAVLAVHQNSSWVVEFSPELTTLPVASRSRREVTLKLASSRAGSGGRSPCVYSAFA